MNNCLNYRFYHNDKGLIESKDVIFVAVVKQVNLLEKNYY